MADGRRISNLGTGLAVYGALHLAAGIGTLALALSSRFLADFGAGFLAAGVLIFLALGLLLLAIGLGLRRRRPLARRGAAGLCYGLSGAMVLAAADLCYFYISYPPIPLAMVVPPLVFIAVFAFAFFRAGRYFSSQAVRAFFPSG